MVAARAGATRPPERASSHPPSRQRLVWGLLGDKKGDNSQVEQLVSALGHAYELKRLSYRSLQHLPNFLLGATRATVRRRGSTVLAPPWPDLVVAAGRRSAPVALWIRERAGGRTRLVHLGRPRAALDAFDLVVTTPQYGLPGSASVRVNALPFQRGRPADPEGLARWQGEFARLPRPWIGVLVGGETWPLRFSADEAAAMGRRISAAAAARGGSLLVTTSPRTGARETEALFRAIDAPALRNDWRDDRPGCYASILELADAFVVTSDSISMLAEACRSGKAVEIYALERRGGPWVWLADRWSAADGTAGGSAAVARWLARTGLLTPPRNVRRVADALVECGAAAAFDPSRLPATRATTLGQAEMEETVALVRALVDSDPVERPTGHA